MEERQHRRTKDAWNKRSPRTVSPDPSASGAGSLGETQFQAGL
jgi:hypothetical protein